MDSYCRSSYSFIQSKTNRSFLLAITQHRHKKYIDLSTLCNPRLIKTLCTGRYSLIIIKNVSQQTEWLTKDQQSRQLSDLRSQALFIKPKYFAKGV